MDQENKENPPKYGYGVRHIQAVIFFLCFTVNIIGRAHISVTIVAMTSIEADLKILHVIKKNDSNVVVNVLSNDSYVISKFHDDKSINESLENLSVTNIFEKEYKTFNWEKWIQEMVLNAFYLGYMIMMFPMGMVCQRYGGKLPLQISLFINAITSFVTPSLTSWGGWQALCCCRLLQGLSQTGTYPCTQALLSKWVPPNERAFLSSFVYAGMPIGTIIAFQLSGCLGASQWGWPLTFHAVGVIFGVCFVLLTVCGTATPMDHKSISKEELSYIMTSSNGGDAKMLTTPWRAILNSKPLWGLIITHAGSVIGYVFFFIQVPTYLHYILGVNISDSGILSSLPYAASILTSIIFGWLSDYCTNNKIVSLTNCRKTFNTIAHFGIAIPLILTSYTSNTTLAVVLLVVAMAAYIGVNCGWMVNYIDLAPNFSGTLTAIGNALANVFVVLTPVVVSYVVTDTRDVMQWRIMFFIIAAVMFITTIAYIVMGTAEIQPWNSCERNETCAKNLKEDVNKLESSHL